MKQAQVIKGLEKEKRALSKAVSRLSRASRGSTAGGDGDDDDVNDAPDFTDIENEEDDTDDRVNAILQSAGASVNDSVASPLLTHHTS